MIAGRHSTELCIERFRCESWQHEGYGVGRVGRFEGRNGTIRDVLEERLALKPVVGRH